MCELKRFLAMVNYYRSFLPCAAEKQMGLNAFCKGNIKNDQTPIVWTDVARDDFEVIKQNLINATILVHPSSSTQLSLAVDASDFAMCGVLQQSVGGKWLPPAFFF